MRSTLSSRLHFVVKTQALQRAARGPPHAQSRVMALQINILKPEYSLASGRCATC